MNLFLSVGPDSSKHRKGDDLFEARGSPALMSTKEVAIRMLKEKYSESFAITINSEKGQAYLFLVKLGLWALVTTFTKNDMPAGSEFGLSETLRAIESAMSGENESLLERLDSSVEKALSRIRKKVEEFSGSLDNSP